MGSSFSVHKSLSFCTKMRFSLSSKTENLLISSPIKDKQAKGDDLIPEISSQTTKSRLQLGLDTPDADNGSKEEAFFDTQTWLESDCEDDFQSINGDYSSSCDHTPNYQRSFSLPPQTEVPFTERVCRLEPECLLLTKKVSLSELLSGNLRQEQVTNDNQDAVSGNLVAKKTHIDNCTKPLDKTPCASRANSTSYKRTPNRDGNLKVNPTLIDVSPKLSDKTPSVSRANSISSDTTPHRDPKQEKMKALKATQCCLPSFVHSLSFSERKKRRSPSYRENTAT